MPRRKSPRKNGIDLRRVPIVRVRKLGRQGAWAQAWHPHFAERGEPPITTPVIDLDPRRKGKLKMKDALHEALHIAIPGLSEEAVLIASRYQALVLWHLGYRADDEAINENWALPGPNEPHS